MAKISELWDKVEGAVEDVESKRLVVEQTGAAYRAASQDLSKSEANLTSLRDELNVRLGEVLQPTDPRVSVSK